MKKPMAEITLKQTLLSRWNNVVFLLSLVLFGLAYAIVVFFYDTKNKHGAVRNVVFAHLSLSLIVS